MDFLCGPPTLLRAPMDTWVARDLGVATVRADHYPVVAKLMWHPIPVPAATSWLVPIINRIACIDGSVAEAFRHALSLIAPQPIATPVDATRA